MILLRIKFINHLMCLSERIWIRFRAKMSKRISKILILILQLLDGYISCHVIGHSKYGVPRANNST